MTNQQEKRLLQQTLLQENRKQLLLANKQLELSLSRCSRIDCLGAILNNDELERFEALTSRFARLADLILQKAIRLIEVLELEASGTILDRINKAEKRGLIESCEQFIQIRQLRNSIAHEYNIDAVLKIVEDCLVFTPVLLSSVGKITTYIEDNALIGSVE